MFLLSSLFWTVKYFKWFIFFITRTATHLIKKTTETSLNLQNRQDDTSEITCMKFKAVLYSSLQYFVKIEKVNTVLNAPDNAPDAVLFV